MEARELAVQLSNVEVGYGAVPVLHGVDLEVRSGEVVALVGPNGAGKTTLLRTISGLLTPSVGEVMLLGRQVDRRRPERNTWRGLAHVPEGRGLLGDLTVEQNLVLARGERISRRELLDRTETLFPQLIRLRKRKAKLLSGGEQQMLCLARAIVRRPQVLIVDELSLGLAPQRTQELLRTVKQAAEEQGHAVLLVEQHVKMALEVANRVYVLARGKIVMHATAEEIGADLDLLAEAYLGADAGATPVG